MDYVDVINLNPPSEMVEHLERMCNNVNDPIPEHENDGTDPESIQFACPEQMPPSTDEQCNTSDKPKCGRTCKPTPPETSKKPKRCRGRPPKCKGPLSSSDAPEPKKPKVYHTRGTTQPQINFT